jgi:peptidoglycan/LPS O-acetylase OafA/YrhL
MSLQLLDAVGKLRSSLKLTGSIYRPLPQDLSQGGSAEPDGVLAEKHIETIPRWYWTLLPWFLAAPLGKTKRKLPKKTSTSYLNGIRGIACLIVYTEHVSMHYYRDFMSNPYGAEPAASNHGFSQLPIIRIIYAGKGMVAIFFVLSGFVLIYSPLKKITTMAERRQDHSTALEVGRYSHNATDSWTNILRQHEGLPGAQMPTAPTPPSDELITGLCSSILRRGFRLFAPMLVVACMSCLITWHYPSFFPGNWRANDPTFLEHVWRFVGITLPVFNPFQWGTYHPLSFNQCWTLPIEYRGSMVVFLMCIATARLTTRARKIVVLGLALWALYLQHGDVFTFLSGMFLAELRTRPLSDDMPFLTKVPWPITYTLSVCVLLLSLMVMGWPENGPKDIEPFQTLLQFTPTAWRANAESVTFFWSYASAPFLLTAVENLPPAQWLLSIAPILYLGEISFALYLLHWMAFLWPGWEMMIRMVNVLHWPMDYSFYLMYFTILALLIVAADYFWRVIDERCVKIAKALVNWLGVHRKVGK